MIIEVKMEERWLHAQLLSARSIGSHPLVLASRGISRPFNGPYNTLLLS
jgi:hypothetical protein